MTNTRIQDMDIALPDQLDERRTEILVDGLSSFHGAQLAVDTTLVSALRRGGGPRSRCADVDGAVLESRSLEEGAPLPRALRQTGQNALSHPRGRSWRTVVTGDSTLLAAHGQSEGSP